MYGKLPVDGFCCGCCNCGLVIGPWSPLVLPVFGIIGSMTSTGVPWNAEWSVCSLRVGGAIGDVVLSSIEEARLAIVGFPIGIGMLADVGDVGSKNSKKIYL
jgi:hypothetical protein